MAEESDEAGTASGKSKTKKGIYKSGVSQPQIFASDKSIQGA